MAVPALNLSIEKGTTFSTSLKLKLDGAVTDLTGYTFSAKMRKHYTASTYYEFTVTPNSPLSSGIVNLQMSSGITTSIPIGRYVYDLLATNSGVVRKVIEGTIIVKGTVS